MKTLPFRWAFLDIVAPFGVLCPCGQVRERERETIMKSLSVCAALAAVCASAGLAQATVFDY
jgi:hypothetical protein